MSLALVCFLLLKQTILLPLFAFVIVTNITMKSDLEEERDGQISQVTSHH